MKAALQIRQKQQLALTPQLQQAIHLLQLSTADLEQEIDRAISQNPFLERLDVPRTDTIALRADGSLHAPVHDDWAGTTASGQRMGSLSGRETMNTGMTAGTVHTSEGKAGTASPDAPPSFDGPGDIARTGASERDIATGNDPDTMGEGWDLDYDTAASHGDDAWGSGMGTGSADGSEGDDAFNPALSTEPTLQAHLLAQLGEIRCTPRQPPTSRTGHPCSTPRWIVHSRHTRSPPSWTPRWPPCRDSSPPASAPARPANACACSFCACRKTSPCHRPSRHKTPRPTVAPPRP